MLDAALIVLLLVVDVWAIIALSQSRAPTGVLLGWSALILLMPFIGAVVWFFTGPRRG